MAVRLLWVATPQVAARVHAQACLADRHGRVVGGRGMVASVVDADSAHLKAMTADRLCRWKSPWNGTVGTRRPSDESDGDGGRDADAGIERAQEETAQAPRVPDWAQHGELTLEVTRAKGLKDVQAIGAQDPYIRVHLLPAEVMRRASLPVPGGVLCGRQASTELRSPGPRPRLLRAGQRARRNLE